MGQIDARAEDASAAIFRMLDLAAAQHDDLRIFIEQRQVDADFHGVQRALIFCIQKSLIDVSYDRGEATPAYDRARKLHDAVPAKSPRQIDRFGSRMQHGVAEVRAGSLVRQNRGNEQALVDFGAAAVALKASVFGGDFLAARYKTRQDVRSCGDQLLNAQRAG